MIRHNPIHAACLCVVALLSATAAAPDARAGTVLLSRESELRATGAGAGTEYDMSNGTAGVDEWSDALLSDPDAPARSLAQQHSATYTGDGGAFSGATAVGAARAAVAAGVDDAFSDAATEFDLFFTVADRPAVLRLDATLNAAGDATSGILVRRPSRPDSAVVSVDVNDGSQTLNESAVLEPGTYGLSVWAFARGTPAESAASYLMTVSLADAQGGVAPMPLPAAAWAGAVGLALAAAVVGRARRRTRSVN